MTRLRLEVVESLLLSLVTKASSMLGLKEILQTVQEGSYRGTFRDIWLVAGGSLL